MHLIGILTTAVALFLLLAAGAWGCDGAVAPGQVEDPAPSQTAGPSSDNRPVTSQSGPPDEGSIIPIPKVTNTDFVASLWLVDGTEEQRSMHLATCRREHAWDTLAAHLEIVLGELAGPDGAVGPEHPVIDYVLAGGSRFPEEGTDHPRWMFLGYERPVTLPTAGGPLETDWFGLALDEEAGTFRYYARTAPEEWSFWDVPGNRQWFLDWHQEVGGRFSLIFMD